MVLCPGIQQAGLPRGIRLLLKPQQGLLQGLTLAGIATAQISEVALPGSVVLVVTLPHHIQYLGWDLPEQQPIFTPQPIQQTLLLVAGVTLGESSCQPQQRLQ
jgi:hypothetical protein